MKTLMLLKTRQPNLRTASIFVMRKIFYWGFLFLLFEEVVHMQSVCVCVCVE